MQDNPFNYFLNVRRAIVVVSMNGNLRAADREKFEKCMAEVKQLPAKYVILNLQGFTDYDPTLASLIVNLQTNIRESSTLILAELAAGVRQKLATKGLIRESEIVGTLKDALQLVLTMDAGMK